MTTAAVHTTRTVVTESLRLDVVRDPSVFLSLSEQWNSLLTNNPQRENPFLTHEWFRAWWEAFGPGKEMLILLVKAGTRLIAIIPLMRSRIRYHGLPIRLLSMITNGHTNRADFVVAERHSECVRLALGFIRTHAADWDMAEFDFLPANSPTVAGILEHAPQFGFACAPQSSYQSPFITLSGPWDEFYASRDGHFRRNLKNREKRLTALGPVRYEECPPSLHAFLDEMFTVGDRSWKGAERSAIASTPALRQFYTRLAELAHPRGRLSIHLLRVGSTPVAFHYSLRNDGVLYLLKTEYDTAYHSYSPGHQIQKHVLQSCFQRGLRAFEFLGPDMDWKREWTNQVKPHVRLRLFHRSLRSRALALLEVRIKPSLKRSGIHTHLRMLLTRSTHHHA